MRFSILLLCFLSSVSYGQTIGVNDLLEMKLIKDKVSPGPLFNYLDKKGLETGRTFKDSTGVFVWYAYHAVDTVEHKASILWKTMIDAVRLSIDPDGYFVGSAITDKVGVYNRWFDDLAKNRFLMLKKEGEEKDPVNFQYFSNGNYFAILASNLTEYGRRYELTIIDK
ncbi:MAG: hypothetical protein EOP48_14565 [Sphingobacteriales bacterium]|nr:MAG: hypothetical protein EOP48_14565 [Sphingobacteriales bacterium]